MVQPVNVGAGEVFTVSVELIDSGGVRARTANDVITLTVSGGASLVGNTSVAAVAGLATFNDLSVSSLAVNLRLTASGAGQSVQSAPFSVEDPCAVFVSALAPGLFGEESLGPTDCQLNRLLPLGLTAFVDRWQLALPATTSLRIDQTSAEFDAFLLLTDDQNELLAFDDDSGLGTDARIAQTLPAGDYVILASSLVSGETGAYRLDLTAVSACDAGVGTMVPDQVMNGVLALGDCMPAPGRHLDQWNLILAEPTTFDAIVSSAVFGPFAGSFTFGGDRQLSGLSDPNPGAVSVEHVLPAGTYWLFATSDLVNPAAPPAGAYSIEARTIAEPQDGCLASSTAVTGGSVAAGRISNDDCMLDPPVPREFDIYEASLLVGETLSATLTADFDFRLQVVVGGLVTEDMMGTAGGTRTISVTADQDGFYVFLVLPDVAGTTGDYSLTFSDISVTSPPPLAARRPLASMTRTRSGQLPR